MQNPPGQADQPASRAQQSADRTETRFAGSSDQTHYPGSAECPRDRPPSSWRGQVHLCAKKWTGGKTLRFGGLVIHQHNQGNSAYGRKSCRFQIRWKSFFLNAPRKSYWKKRDRNMHLFTFTHFCQTYLAYNFLVHFLGHISTFKLWSQTRKNGSTGLGSSFSKKKSKVVVPYCTINLFSSFIIKKC